MSVTDLESVYQELLVLIKTLSAYGPFAGILLTMIEAIFPPLPLVVFVTINVIAYGFLLGYIYSFIGTFLGSWIMYLLIQRFAQRWFERMVHRSKRLDQIMLWIRRQGFVPIFILFSIPIMPSLVVSGISGLAGVKRDEYFIALFLGKMVMVFTVSFVGYNLASFVEQPLKSAVFLGIVVVFTFVGKMAVKWYEKSFVEKNHF